MSDYCKNFIADRLDWRCTDSDLSVWQREEIGRLFKRSKELVQEIKAEAHTERSIYHIEYHKLNQRVVQTDHFLNCCQDLLRF